MQFDDDQTVIDACEETVAMIEADADGKDVSAPAVCSSIGWIHTPPKWSKKDYPWPPITRRFYGSSAYRGSFAARSAGQHTSVALLGLSPAF